MHENNRKSKGLSRREFGRLVLATVPAAMVVGRSSSLFANAARPNSLINGVQVGVIAPYSYHNPYFTSDDVPGDVQSLLKYMVENGISACEMQAEAAEPFAGSPVKSPPLESILGRGRAMQAAAQESSDNSQTRAGTAGGAGAAGSPARRGPVQNVDLAAAIVAAFKVNDETLKPWRISVSMDKFKDLRKLYNAAGVSIYAFRFALTNYMSDQEYDYAFNVVQALGANQLTMELPEEDDLSKRIGEFAAKRKIMVGYHAHTQATPTLWDTALSQSNYNGVNFDIGHYVAGTSQNPIPFIQAHHDRITSIHLKDRKNANGPNMPFGQGDTPIKEVLQLMKANKYKFPATIEREYAIPAGSDTVKEVGKCLDFCREGLKA